MEMRYSIDSTREIHVKRRISWPKLRISGGKGQAAFRREYGDIQPSILIDRTEWKPGPLNRVRLGSALSIEHRTARGIKLTRIVFPCVDKPVVFEVWRMKNVSGRALTFLADWVVREDEQEGISGAYYIRADARGVDHRTLLPGETVTIRLAFGAYRNQSEYAPDLDWSVEERKWISAQRQIKR